MKTKFTLFAFCAMLSAGVMSQTIKSVTEPLPGPQIINVYARNHTLLNGQWSMLIDQYDVGYMDYRGNVINERGSFFADDGFSKHPDRLTEYDFDTADRLEVPGDWNTQMPELYYYEGSVWYRKLFPFNPQQDKRYFIYFAAANYEAVAGLNGKKIGRHIGGYTPFNFEVTGGIKQGENSVIVKVNNARRPEGIPTNHCDWWNYGGLTRDVMIIETPSTFIRDYKIQLAKGSYNQIAGWLQLDGPDKSPVTISIPELKIKQTVTPDADGYAQFTVKAKPKLWDCDNPKLYNVILATDKDTITDRIGFRQIETDGSKILLNGKNIFCRGVSIHEEKPYGMGGRAFSREQDMVLLEWAKEMECNFVRLAHYPHNEQMVRAAEEMGILVWSEIPVYWTIHWTDPETYANAEQQLEDMITRDKNRANVVVWSVSNETPRGAERLSFLKKLIAKARQLDDTRLVSSAMEKEYSGPSTVTILDELAEYVDLLSFNEYIGWYDGNSDKCDRMTWEFSVDKPVFISEFGAGAVYGMHGDVSERFTEEYMADLYKRQINMFENMPQLAGTTPWVLKDFRSPRRQLHGIQGNYNRKGLISDQGQKKQAFYIMQEWYSALKSRY